MAVIVGQQSGWAQSRKTAYSLNECIEYAKTKSPDIVTASIEAEQSQKKINEIAGSGLPQITLSGSMMNNLKLPVQVLPGELMGGPAGSYIPLSFGTKYSFGLSGQATQMLFNGSFWLGLNAAKYSNQYYTQHSDYVSEQTAYSIAAIYYHTIVLQKKIRLLEQNCASIEKTLADTKLLYANGKAREVDVDRLTISANVVRFQLKNTANGLTQAYNNLKFQMGMPIETAITLTDSIALAGDGSIDGAAGIDAAGASHDSRLDMQMLRTTMRLQELDKQNTIAQFYPVINAVGSYSVNGMRSSFDLFDAGKAWYRSYSVGIQLSIPIFTGGQRIARVQQASLAIDKVKEQMRKAEAGVDVEVSNAQRAYTTASDNISTDRLNVALAQKVYTITTLEYEQGSATASMLVDAETRLREAQTNYITSLLNLCIARLDVEKSRGTLTQYLHTLDTH